MNEFEVTQMLRDAIDQDPEGRVWHVNTKHLVAFAQMVESNAKTNCKQREWVGLTLGERSFLFIKADGLNSYAEAIEAKLKEKNT